MSGKRTRQPTQFFSPPVPVELTSAKKLDRKRKREGNRKNREIEAIAKRSLHRFLRAKAGRCHEMNAQAIDRLKVSRGDEIIFDEDDCRFR
jgi:hypothetical protein